MGSLTISPSWRRATCAALALGAGVLAAACGRESPASARTSQASACVAGTLTVGATRQGTLDRSSCVARMRFGADSGYVDRWTLHLAPLQRITVWVRSRNGVPLYIYLSGPGRSRAEADGDVNRLRFTARAGGDYTVTVAQTNPDRRSYPYTIRVEERRY